MLAIGRGEESKLVKIADMGEGGCNKSGKNADVVYGWPHGKICNKYDVKKRVHLTW